MVQGAFYRALAIARAVHARDRSARARCESLALTTHEWYVLLLEIESWRSLLDFVNSRAGLEEAWRKGGGNHAKRGITPLFAALTRTLIWMAFIQLLPPVLSFFEYR